MGIRLIACCAALLGAGYLVLGQSTSENVDPIVAASIEANADRGYTVSNMEDGTACLIDTGRVVSGRSHAIRPGSDCDQVWPGLAGVRNWTQNDDGTVILTDGTGQSILTLGIGDGVDFESLEPANAVLAFNEFD